MNKHYLIGNLTRDPETGTTESGVNWCRFDLAVRKKYAREGGPTADFIQVTAWRGLGDTCAKYLKKGSKVAVIGTPQAAAWIGKDGQAKGQLQVTAEDIEFCSGGQRSDTPTDEDALPDPADGMMPVDDPDDPF